MAVLRARPVCAAIPALGLGASADQPRRCVSLFGQLGEGFSPIHAGLTLTAMVLGLIVGMVASFALVARLGRHLLHVGIALVGAGAVILALTVTGAHTASTLDLAPDCSYSVPAPGWRWDSCSTSSSPA